MAGGTPSNANGMVDSGPLRTHGVHCLKPT